MGRYPAVRQSLVALLCAGMIVLLIVCFSSSGAFATDDEPDPTTSSEAESSTPAAPSFVLQPRGGSFISGSTYALSVRVVGEEVPVITWQYREEASAAWRPVEGATQTTDEDASSVTSELQAGMSGFNRAIASNSVASDVASEEVFVVEIADETGLVPQVESRSSDVIEKSDGQDKEGLADTGSPIASASFLPWALGLMVVGAAAVAIRHRFRQMAAHARASSR